MPNNSFGIIWNIYDIKKIKTHAHFPQHLSVLVLYQNLLLIISSLVTTDKPLLLQNIAVLNYNLGSDVSVL